VQGASSAKGLLGAGWSCVASEWAGGRIHWMDSVFPHLLRLRHQVQRGHGGEHHWACLRQPRLQIRDQTQSRRTMKDMQAPHLTELVPCATY